MELLIAFVVGLVVMDAMWAWRLGIPQAMWYRWKYRKQLKEQDDEWNTRFPD